MTVLYERETSDSVETVGSRLEGAVAAHKFGVLGIIDLREKMESKGVAFGPRCMIYEICNPHRAKEVLEKNMAISTALPCRIAVYEADDKVTVSTVLPTKMLAQFETPELMPIAESVESDIKAIIDESIESP